MIRCCNLFTPLRSTCGLVFLAALMIGGLAWVSVAALGVEEAQREAAARADAMNKERLALWRLECFMLPPIGLENNRPYAHYFALHVPAPIVLTAADEADIDPGRVPSPLLSTDLPEWVRLHFHIDPDQGWNSPQVISADLAARLNKDPLDLSLANVTTAREKLLLELRAQFPTTDILARLRERDRIEPDPIPPYVVPVPFSDDPATDKPAPYGQQGEPAGWSKPSDPSPTRDPNVPGILGAVQTNSAGYTRAGSQFGQPFEQLFQSESPKDESVKSMKLRSQEKVASELARNVEEPDPRAQQQLPISPAPQDAQTPAARGSSYPLPLRQDLSADGAARQLLAQNVLTGRGANEGKFGNYKANSQAAGNVPPPASRPQPDAYKLKETRGGVEQQNEELRRSVFDWVDNLGKNIQNRSRESVDENNLKAPPCASKDAPEPQAAKKAEATAVDKIASAAPAAPVASADVPAPGTVRKAEDAKSGLTRPGRADAPAGKPGVGPGSVSGLGEAKEPERGQESLENARRQSGRYLALAKTVGHDGRPLQPVVAGERKPAPVVQPAAVHLGPMRPRWVTAPDGTEHLFIVRAAQVDNKTNYQGVLVDWPVLQATLAAQVADLFPAAVLKPVAPAEETSSDLTMTTLPVRLDPGPPPLLPPVGWSPLRIGLVLAWVAALLAIGAVGIGGRAVLALSERRIRFVSAVTHELRSPLTALQLHLDLLNSGLIQDEAKKSDYLATIGNEAQRLNRLVENVLDFARLEKRTALASAQSVPVVDLVETVRMTWADRLHADGFELLVHSTAAPDAKVLVDPRVIAQVLGNLLDNARKYSRDAADRRIWLWVKPGDRGRVVLEVEDRGPGIPAGERRGIFRPFHRGADNNHSGGVGLGLALARQWAELYRGTITYRPADGGTGACFRLELRMV